MPVFKSTGAEYAAVLDSVGKSFQGTAAIKSLSLKIPTAGVFALVGPDGAGKSTLLQMLCGLLTPDSGSLEVLGVSLPRGLAGVRPQLGYLSQHFSLYGDLSIDENMAFAAEIYGLKNYSDKRDELLEMTGLTPFRKRLADKLSGGMKQKLALACTLVHNPRLILLDEPTNGVDPVSRREFWKLLRGLGEQNITLVMSTPYMDEAERADSVAFIHEGKLLLTGSPGAIRRSWDRKILEIFCARNRAAMPVLSRFYPKGELQIFGDRVHLAMLQDGPEEDEVVRCLEDAGIRVKSSGPVRPRLENVFLSMIQKEAAVNG
ncbi:MAG: ABC transporter ATP-binding protein [Spirochaetes bacterium]|nr:MAG: ABC transporter ATP-binding protein [Spirochaetota bacterium]